MFSNYRVLFFLLLGFGIATSQAATTIVTPGTGTLKTAVDAAAEDDVLLLQTGTYNLNANIAVDVGITIRPEDNTAQPSIVLNGHTITLNHATGTTTLQKLDFTGGGTVRTSAAKVLNVLENTFTDVHLSLNSTTGPCYIIGNNTQRTGTTSYDVSLDGDCYSAGNTFNNLRILTANSGYFIGNKVSANYNGSTAMAVYAAYAIGNEFIRDLDTNSPTNSNSNYNVVVFRKPQQTGLTSNWPLIANNIFRVIGGSGSAPGQPIKSMMAANLNTSSQLHNNVIDYAQLQWATQGNRGMIWVNSNSTIQGNIVVNGNSTINMPAIGFLNDTERTQSDVSYNDCFDNASDCGNTDGNIAVDPDFVDSVDYALTSGSPAINAGPPNEHLNDLDGSRNDMGVHGGPHPISQYKDQLNGGTAPFVYPVFNETQTLSGAQVEVTAIGVARFK